MPYPESWERGIKKPGIVVVIGDYSKPRLEYEYFNVGKCDSLPNDASATTTTTKRIEIPECHGQPRSSLNQNSYVVNDS